MEFREGDVRNLVFGFLFGIAATAAAIFLFDDADPPATIAAGPDRAADAAASHVAEVRQPAVSVPQPRDAGDSSTLLSSPGLSPPGAAAPAMSASIRTAEIPGASLESQSDGDPPLKRLLEAFRIDCQYGPGYGGNWSKGLMTPHSASWQGGIITFDTLDLVAGTAMLKTSSGLTRTENGELEVRVQASETGLHFTVFAPGGELIVATVYGSLDAQGKNAAVASFHGPHLNHESAQFYGACTSS